MFRITEGEFNVLIAVSILIAILSIPFHIPAQTIARVLELLWIAFVLIIYLRRTPAKRSATIKQ
jgi:hypothetical protein